MNKCQKSGCPQPYETVLRCKKCGRVVATAEHPTCRTCRYLQAINKMNDHYKCEHLNIEFGYIDTFYCQQHEEKDA